MADDKYKSDAIRIEGQLRNRRLLKNAPRTGTGVYLSDQEASEKYVKAASHWYSYIASLDSNDRMYNQSVNNMFEDLKNARKLAYTKKEKGEVDSIIALRQSQFKSDKGKQSATSLETLARANGYLAILSFAGALLAISLKLTGSVVGPSSANNKWIGLCLFLVGCMFTFFYFRVKRKK